MPCIYRKKQTDGPLELAAVLMYTESAWNCACVTYRLCLLYNQHSMSCQNI
jgi:hypothetical protein